jgi:rubrerythrin
MPCLVRAESLPESGLDGDGEGMMSQPNRPGTSKWPPEMLNVLETCKHIHKYAEEFYQYLSEVHHEHRDIARMWGLLAIDKCNHSDTFMMAYRIKGDGISEISISPEIAAGILAKMKAIPKGDIYNPPSVVDALRFTVRMEENLSNVHFSKVVKFTSEQDSDLMSSSIKSSSYILHLMTEEYVNLTLFNDVAW